MLRSLIRLPAAMLLAAAMCVGTGATAQAEGRCGTHPWCDTSLSPVTRADMVLAQMTTEEKVDFLGGDSFQGGTQSGPDNHTGVQDGVPRLDVPTVYYTDGPLGPRQGSSTGMPAPLGLAATFNPAMARLYGEVVGNEARDKGNDAIFGPTVNIMRTPLGGRTYEAFGEDPFLTSSIAVPWIDGAQSQGVMADVKHFAENNQEGADPTGQFNQPGQILGVGVIAPRYIDNAVVDDRTLHEIELPAFQAAVQQAHVATVMCSYNMVDGTYSCENGHLLQTILRGQWGFDGYVLADYGAAHDTVASLNNGLDFEPWPPAAYQPLEIDAALLTGQVSTVTLDEHVRAILETWFRFGVFDRAAYVNDDDQIDKPAHAADAQRIEEQAITLLRNPNHLLPLHASKLRRIAVIGKAAGTFVTGGGSGNVIPFQFTSVLAAIRARVGPHVQVTYDDGSDPAAAVADARAADVSVVVASDYYTEGADRSCLTLECPDNNGDQDSLIDQVSAANHNTAVVLESGGPDLTPWRDQVGALLEAWYPGGPGGSAVAHVLFGDADPGGRLPVTFPASGTAYPTADDPAEYPGIGNQVDYNEGVLVGYRWYDAEHVQPAFPFGYGLSYTSFRFSGLRVSHVSGPGDRYDVRVTVTNTGRRRGWAVPEVYVAVPAPAGLTQPPDQLKGFGKVSLAPHHHTTVTIGLDASSFSYWDTDSQSWQIQPGCDAVMVGTSSGALPLRTAVAQGGANCGDTVKPVRRRHHHKPKG
jgi:beta-glucosidase